MALNLDVSPLARLIDAVAGEIGLTVWIADPAVGEGDLKSELLKDVLRAFRAEGIEIAYPRRDVRMITTPETRNFPASSST